MSRPTVFCAFSDKLVTFLVTEKEERLFQHYKIMSGNGSDYENDGDFMQEPSAKKSKIEDAPEEHGEVLQLHTDWEQRDAAVRHSACKKFARTCDFIPNFRIFF